MTVRSSEFLSLRFLARGGKWSFPFPFLPTKAWVGDFSLSPRGSRKTAFLFFPPPFFQRVVQTPPLFSSRDARMVGWWTPLYVGEDSPILFFYGAGNGSSVPSLFFFSATFQAVQGVTVFFAPSVSKPALPPLFFFFPRPSSTLPPPSLSRPPLLLVFSPPNSSPPKRATLFLLLPGSQRFAGHSFALRVKAFPPSLPSPSASELKCPSSFFLLERDVSLFFPLSRRAGDVLASMGSLFFPPTFLPPFPLLFFIFRSATPK